MNLPDAPDFRSKKPVVTVEQAVAFSEQWLPYFNARPDFEAQRLKTKAQARFKL